ncbi:MAG: hypothetical protein ACKO5K_07280, partial [Armatimonadota bacterium]
MRPQPTGDWFWDVVRPMLGRLALVTALLVGALGWWRGHGGDATIRTALMPLRALLDPAYARHVSIPAKPAWLKTKGSALVIDGCPADFPIEVTTHRPFQRKGGLHQRWRIEPVGDDIVRVTWWSSSRWDGKSEHTAVKTMTRKQLAGLHGGRGIVVWRPGDDAASVHVANPLVATAKSLDRSFAKAVERSPFNQWERQVASANHGESSAT